MTDKAGTYPGDHNVIKARLQARFPWLKAQRPGGDYFAVSPGWLKLLEDFFAEVGAVLPDGKGFELTMLGEKRGGLRLAYRLGPDVPVLAAARLALARQLAQGRAYHRCQTCGDPGQLYTVAGWWTVSCGQHLDGEAAMREAEPFRRNGDYVGTVAGGLQVGYLPDDDRLVRVERRLGVYVITESEDVDLLAEATRWIEKSRADERLAAAQQQIAAETKMSDLGDDATEIDMMEEATRLQREARTMPPRWMCTECLTEGVGPWPSYCPTCGQEGRWYSPPGDDPRPAKERWDELQCYFKRRDDRNDD